MIKSVASIFLCLSLLACEKSASPTADRVPAWAKEAVWYQIFPERFRNGDTGNDPTVQDISGGWPFFEPKAWQIQPWTSDWYKLQPWEKNTGRDFYWENGLRRYGGDLQGVLDKLDYLQEFGITAIYFNPLFESPSLHKYDAAMYHHIDNNFGPDPEGDRAIWAKENPADPTTWQWTAADRLFLKLLDECHARGIKVIIDGVFNHVGNTFWAFEDVIKKQQASVYKDWFIINSWDDPATADTVEFDYAGWYGVRSLPEIREDENGLVGGIREHVHAIVRRWMDPNGDGDPIDGIDGWRLDVAEMVKLNFWREFRSWVKTINPDAYITGEVWWENWRQNKMFDAAPWLAGDAFDAVMNYRFAAAIKQFVIDDKTQISATEFVEKLQAVQRDYHPENFAVLQNLMDSHDVDRLASQIVNPDRWYDHDARPEPGNNYDVRKPNAIEREKQKMIVGLQMALPGAPMIYYGDEAGMWGGDDPDCRKPMVWRDMQYDAEKMHPYGRPRPADAVAFDETLFAWYQHMIRLRKQNPALSLGRIDYFLVDSDRAIIGFRRSYEKSELFVVLNNRAVEQRIDLDLRDFALSATELRNLVSRTQLNGEDGVFEVNMSPYTIAVFERIVQ